MRFGVEGAIRGRQVHAGFGNQPQSAPLAVAFDAKHVGYGLLCPSVTCIGHHATILIFHRTQGRYFLLNQHGHALQ